MYTEVDGKILPKYPQIRWEKSHFNVSFAIVAVITFYEKQIQSFSFAK